MTNKQLDRDALLIYPQRSNTNKSQDYSLYVLKLVSKWFNSRCGCSRSMVRAIIPKLQTGALVVTRRASDVKQFPNFSCEFACCAHPWRRKQAKENLVLTLKGFNENKCILSSPVCSLLLLVSELQQEILSPLNKLNSYHSYCLDAVWR